MPTLDDLAASISMHRLHGHIGELVIVIQRCEYEDIEHVSAESDLIKRCPYYRRVERMALGILTGEDLVGAGNGEYLVPVKCHALWTPQSNVPVVGEIRVDRIWQYGSLEDAVFEVAGMNICHLCSIVAGNQEAAKAFQLEYDPYTVLPRKHSTIEALYILATYAGAREILDSALAEM